MHMLDGNGTIVDTPQWRNQQEMARKIPFYFPDPQVRLGAITVSASEYNRLGQTAANLPQSEMEKIDKFLRHMGYLPENMTPRGKIYWARALYNEDANGFGITQQP
jgi:hypothetical protein